MLSGRDLDGEAKRRVRSRCQDKQPSHTDLKIPSDAPGVLEVNNPPAQLQCGRKGLAAADLAPKLRPRVDLLILGAAVLALGWLGGLLSQ